jgi:hydrogenase-4 component F
VILELVTPSGLVALVPLLAAGLLLLVQETTWAAWGNIAASAVAFALACLLPWSLGAGDLLLVDRLAAHMAILTSFVGLTTAVFSRRYIAVEAQAGRLDARALRQYHALFQAFLGFMLLALLSNNLGVTWGAVEAATIAAVLVVGLPRTADAIEASWKFFIICSVAVALALFGTIVLYLAAQPALGPGLPAMSWSHLAEAAPRFKGPLLNLAFVFMLIGYGTKAGLAPLHAWMPDAHAEGPTPVSAVLAGSILNVALVVILRLHGLLAGNAEAISPGPPIIAFGILTMLFATFSLWRRRDVKRFFAFSTVEHSGIAALAIGIGGKTAMFAALLHITVHTLVKSAIFQCVGRACQLKGGQLFTDIGGLLLGKHRMLGLTLAAGIAAIAGLPPFGVFSSEFLVVTEVTKHVPWLVVPVALALVVGAWALFWRFSTLCLGAATPDRGPAPTMADLAPAWLHLALAVVLGFAMPAALVDWFTAIAEAAR